MAKTTEKYLSIANLVDKLNSEVEEYGFSLHFSIDTLNDTVQLSVNSLGFFKEEVGIDKAIDFNRTVQGFDADVIGDVTNKFEKIEVDNLSQVEL